MHWLIDRYRVRTDKRSGIVNDPNRLDDPQYIIRLMGKVMAVSLETVQIVGSLPELKDTRRFDPPKNLYKHIKQRVRYGVRPDRFS